MILNLSLETSLKVLRFLLCSTFLTAFVVGCQDNKAILKESEKQLDAGTPQAAVDGLEAFIKTEPEEPKARLLLGEAYNALGRHNDAVEQLRKASQLYAAQPEERTAARLELARTYLRFGDRTSAFRVLRLVQRSTSDPETLRKIIELVGDSYQTKQLTTGDSDNYSPTFSPDGTQIAFASFPN